MEKEGLYLLTKIISGNVVERRKSRITRKPGKRGMRRKGNSNERQIAGNREAAVLQLTRILNCNMKPGDLLLTLNLSPEGLQAVGGTYEGVKAAARKFLNRLLYRLKKQETSCKWVLVPSEVDGATGELVRPHVHLVLTGEGFSWIDRSLLLFGENVAQIWGLGQVDVQFLRHQEDYYPLAAYLIRQARGTADEKKYSCSRNMKKPKVEHQIVHSGGALRIPSGAMELPGTKYDPEKGQNFVRYLPKAKRDPSKKIGGHRETAFLEEWPDRNEDP